MESLDAALQHRLKMASTTQAQASFRGRRQLWRRIPLLILGAPQGRADS
jgi:hypothetical protein